MTCDPRLSVQVGSINLLILFISQRTKRNMESAFRAWTSMSPESREEPAPIRRRTRSVTVSACLSRVGIVPCCRCS